MANRKPPPAQVIASKSDVPRLFNVDDRVTAVLSNSSALEPAMTLDTRVREIEGDRCQIDGSDEWFSRLTGGVIARVPDLYLAIHTTGYGLEGPADAKKVTIAQPNAKCR